MLGLFITLFMAMVLFSVAGAIFEVFPVFSTALIIYLVVQAVKKQTGNQKQKSAKQKTNYDESKALENLRTYFKKYDRLYFNDETYIVPTGSDGKAGSYDVTYETLDIYMRDEFVATMADYKLAFPNSYNAFLKQINDYVKHANRTKAAAEQPVSKKAPSSTQTASKTEELKNAQYYIDTFTKLNDSINEEHITDGLNETINYLKQIKAIEENFPVSKEKTNKLYQYYLPMLNDILENYKRLSINADSHKEFKENEDRLIKTIVLINSAMQTLTESLVDEYYLEMSADMKTLEALLKKDGLASEELTFESVNSNKKKEEKVEVNGN